MVRKSIIAVILLILVVGLSYIKVVRDQDEPEPEKSASQIERDSAADPLAPPPEIIHPTDTMPALDSSMAVVDEPPKPDTMTDVLKQTIRDYCQSVYERLPDDLTLNERSAAAQNIAKETASRFAVSENKVRSLWQPEQTSTTEPSDNETQEAAGPSIADKVETFFKDRTAELPGDLTDVEQKIALDEIRKETADRYSLSLNEVYAIWEKRDLTEISAAELDKVGVERKTVPESDSHRRRIADYYRDRFDSLPANLTEYERTVAIAELKYETAAHFSISLSEFEKIWQEYQQSDS